MAKNFPTEQLDLISHNMNAAIGKAVSQWSSVEGSLCEFFKAAVTARDSESAFFALSAINSAEVRIHVVDAAAKWTFKNRENVLNDWSQIVKELHTGRKFRNKIAHGQVIRTEIGERNVGNISFVPHYHLGHRLAVDAFHPWDLVKTYAVHLFLRALSHKIKKMAFFLEYRDGLGEEYPSLPQLSFDDFVAQSQKDTADVLIVGPIQK